MKNIKNSRHLIMLALTIFMLTYVILIVLNDLHVILLPHWLSDNFLFGLIFYTLAISSLDKKR
ncbi:hypothetical protein R078138_01555 [Convivina praedatoris]|uniref:Bacteriocin immunity protein n=1 Tax=Convivina praedatoris TaxID=2880963 RepID=A0ABM9D4I5_9LACO|nr:hypothetical protein R077815_01327 [Convivina sp. LMG 32447]CAH1856507.1 hypothetical protein LMG032447_01303 [Convivina sp. LMG 32447]CAH1857304.1 hypothetical protein R078138_01555 [Convivina sp. LMG 32447]